MTKEIKSTDQSELQQIVKQIAADLGIDVARVQAAVDLLDAGNTLPFIARYRKEATKGLDESQLRAIEDALAKARELTARKATILKSIEQQGLLTDELKRQIETCSDKQTLENIYLPFKPKRRTRATVARERGLQPLADVLLKQEKQNYSRKQILAPYIDPNKDVPDAEAALQGACDIVAEQWSEDVEIRIWLTEQAIDYGRVTSKVKRGKKDAASKFEMYLDHSEAAKRIPSHRLLAMKRGEDEGLLNVGIQLNDEIALRHLSRQWLRNPGFEFASELRATVEDAYRRLLLPATESAVMQDMKEKADEDAIQVFANNLRELLLAAPAGPKVTIGIDPGFRTGCKVAVVDGTGKYLANTTIYPTAPRNDTEGAKKSLLGLIEKYDVKMIAIGNGTASRETDAFVADVLKTQSKSGAEPITKVTVSESGASIYSASELAGREYPDLDLTVRGAISIAHRLQDPLAELVKIDPKSIGVGQYQHDVNQQKLKKALTREVESCVNSVGVDLNMASAPLLSFVAGIGPKLGEAIVAYRDSNGVFVDRKQLTRVPKLGQKAFQQAAGFLRVRDGRQPLDNSAVHPESYYVVEKMAKTLSTSTSALVGNDSLASKLDAKQFVDDQFGLPTVQDILAELAKPGRDPRNEFKAVRFADGVNEIGDLRSGMVLEGVISNVTPFGAFIDLGVHQDGLIHISQLADTFVQDPNEIVKVGDVVKVKVMDVDLDRKRIAVSRKEVAS